MVRSVPIKQNRLGQQGLNAGKESSNHPGPGIVVVRQHASIFLKAFDVEDPWPKRFTLLDFD